MLLPLPVGPVTRIKPCSIAMSCSNHDSVRGSMPSSGRSIEPRAFVEQANDDALAEARGQARDAQIDRAIADLHRRPAILRQPLLGDVHPPHHLDAADDFLLHILRQRVRIIKTPSMRMRTINAIFVRLHVDVRRIGLTASKSIRFTSLITGARVALSSRSSRAQALHFIEHLAFDRACR